LTRPLSPTFEDTTLQRGFRAFKEYEPVATFLESARETSRIMGGAIASYREERARNREWFGEFVRNPSFERFSTADMVKDILFTGIEAHPSVRSIEGTLAASKLMGLGIDYGKAYARRALRADGVSAGVAQDVVDGLEYASFFVGGGVSGVGKAKREKFFNAFLWIFLVLYFNI